MLLAAQVVLRIAAEQRAAQCAQHAVVLPAPGYAAGQPAENGAAQAALALGRAARRRRAVGVGRVRRLVVRALLRELARRRRRVVRGVR